MSVLFYHHHKHLITTITTPSPPQPPHHHHNHPIITTTTPSPPQPPHHHHNHPITTTTTPSSPQPPHHHHNHPITTTTTPSPPQPPHHHHNHPIITTITTFRCIKEFNIPHPLPLKAQSTRATIFVFLLKVDFPFGTFHNGLKKEKYGGCPTVQLLLSRRGDDKEMVMMKEFIEGVVSSILIPPFSLLSPPTPHPLIPLHASSVGLKNMKSSGKLSQQPGGWVVGWVVSRLVG